MALPAFVGVTTSAAAAVFQRLLDEMLLPKLFGRRSDLLRVAFSIADLVHLKDGKDGWLSGWAWQHSNPTKSNQHFCTALWPFEARHKQIY